MNRKQQAAIAMLDRMREQPKTKAGRLYVACLQEAKHFEAIGNPTAAAPFWEAAEAAQKHISVQEACPHANQMAHGRLRRNTCRDCGDVI